MEPHEPLAGCLSWLEFPEKPMRDGDELQGARWGGSWAAPVGGRGGKGRRGGEGKREGRGQDQKRKRSRVVPPSPRELGSWQGCPTMRQGAWPLGPQVVSLWMQATPEGLSVAEVALTDEGICLPRAPSCGPARPPSCGASGQHAGGSLGRSTCLTPTSSTLSPVSALASAGSSPPPSPPPPPARTTVSADGQRWGQTRVP